MEKPSRYGSVWIFFFSLSLSLSLSLFFSLLLSLSLSLSLSFLSFPPSKRKWWRQRGQIKKVINSRSFIHSYDVYFKNGNRYCIIWCLALCLLKKGGCARGRFPPLPFPIPLLLAQKGPTRRFGFGPPDPGPARTGKKNDFYAEQFTLLYPAWGEGGEMWNRRFINTF